jgi:uncharacterized protein YjiS (DUF1127 family)
MRNSHVKPYFPGPSIAQDIANLAAGVRQAVETLQIWKQRAHERRQLLAMSDRGLRDIGITRVDAWREANKPLWR